MTEKGQRHIKPGSNEIGGAWSKMRNGKGRGFIMALITDGIKIWYACMLQPPAKLCCKTQADVGKTAALERPLRHDTSNLTRESSG